VVNSLDNIVGLNTSLNTSLQQIDTINALPVINTPLAKFAPASQVLGNLRTIVRNELLEYESKPPSNTTQVQNKLFNDLGPSGQNILADLNNDGSVGLDDVVISPLSATPFTITLRLKQDASAGPMFQSNFGLGLPAIPLNVPGNVNGQIGFDYNNLTFGDNGQPYFSSQNPVTGGADQFQFALSTNVPGPLSGNMGLIPVTISNPNIQFQPQVNMVVTGGNNTAAFANPTITGNANVSMHLASTFAAASFPTINADFAMSWGFAGTDANAAPTQFGNLQTLRFDNVTLSAGRALQNVLGPVLTSIGTDLLPKPVRQFLGVLTQPIPVLSDLSEAVGLGPVTLQTIADAFADSEGIPHEGLDKLIQLAATLATLENDLQNISSDVHFGSFDLLGANGDVRNFTDSGSLSTGTSTQSDFASGGSAASDFNQIVTTDPLHFSFQAPLLTNPSAGVFKLLLRQHADLFELSGDFDIPFTFRQTFHVFGPLQVGFQGKLDPSAHFDIGYDDQGLRDGNITDGFWIRNTTGFGFSGFLHALAGLDIVVAEVNVTGGLDIPDKNPVGFVVNGAADPEGKIRGIDPSNPFTPTGELDATLGIQLRVGITVFGHFIGWEKDFNLASLQLLCFGGCMPNPNEQPQLASLDSNGKLTLGMGPNANLRQGFRDPAPGDGDETFMVTHVSGSSSDPGGETVDVHYLVPSQNFSEEVTYSGVKRIFADGGAGHNVITIGKGVTAYGDLHGGLAANSSCNVTYLGSGPVDLYAATGDSNLVSESTGLSNFYGGDAASNPVFDTMTLGKGSNLLVKPEGANRNNSIIADATAAGNLIGGSPGSTTRVEIQGTTAGDTMTLAQASSSNPTPYLTTYDSQGRVVSITTLGGVQDLVIDGTTGADSITIDEQGLLADGLQDIIVNVSNPGDLSGFNLIFPGGGPIGNTITINGTSGNDNVAIIPDLTIDGALFVGNQIGSGSNTLVPIHIVGSRYDSNNNNPDDKQVIGSLNRLDTVVFNAGSGNSQVNVSTLTPATIEVNANLGPANIGIEGAVADVSVSGPQATVTVFATGSHTTISGVASATVFATGADMRIDGAKSATVESNLFTAVQGKLHVKNSSLTLDNSSDTLDDTVGSLDGFNFYFNTLFGDQVHLPGLPITLENDDLTIKLQGAAVNNSFTFVNTPAGHTVELDNGRDVEVDQNIGNLTISNAGGNVVVDQNTDALRVTGHTPHVTVEQNLGTLFIEGQLIDVYNSTGSLIGFGDTFNIHNENDTGGFDIGGNTVNVYQAAGRGTVTASGTANVYAETGGLSLTGNGQFNLGLGNVDALLGPISLTGTPGQDSNGNLVGPGATVIIDDSRSALKRTITLDVDDPIATNMGLISGLPAVISYFEGIDLLEIDGSPADAFQVNALPLFEGQQEITTSGGTTTFVHSFFAMDVALHAAGGVPVTVDGTADAQNPVVVDGVIVKYGNGQTTLDTFGGQVVHLDNTSTDGGLFPLGTFGGPVRIHGATDGSASPSVILDSKPYKSTISIGNGEVTGLAVRPKFPFAVVPITYDPAGVSSLTVHANSTGGNTFNLTPDLPMTDVNTGTGADMVNVIGLKGELVLEGNAAGGQLNLSGLIDFTPQAADFIGNSVQIGQNFVVLDNLSALATPSGTFNGTFLDNTTGPLTPGQVFKAGGLKLQFVSYNGDNNNRDVVLQLLAKPPKVVGIAMTRVVEETPATLTATITDPEEPRTVTVNWGDNTPVDTFSLPAGTTSFSATHRYAEENSAGYQAVITATDTVAGGSGSANPTIPVADAPLTFQGVGASAVEFAFAPNILVATLRDPGGNFSTQDYSGTIDWGDGTTSLASFLFGVDRGLVLVLGSHTYLEEGNYKLAVSVQDAGGSTASGTGIAQVTVASGDFADFFLDPNGVLTISGDPNGQPKNTLILDLTSDGGVHARLNLERAEYNAGIVKSIIVNGGAGNDYVDIEKSNVPITVNFGAGTDQLALANTSHVLLGNILAPVTVHGGGQSSLTLNDAADAMGAEWSVTDSTVTGFHVVLEGSPFPIPLPTDVASIQYDHLTTVQINGSGFGSNVVNIGDKDRGIGSLSSVISFTGNGSGNELDINDQGTTAPQSFTLDATSLQRSGEAAILYTNVANLTINGGSGGNIITVKNTAGGTNTTLNSGNGVDNIYVEATTGPLTVNTQQSSSGPGFGGFEAVYVGTSNGSGHTLDGIQGALTVNTVARPGIDYANLALYDNAENASETYTVTSNTILRSGAAPIHYSVTNAVFFFLGGGGNTFNVQSIRPGLLYWVSGGVGNDTFNVGDSNNTLNGIIYQLVISVQNPGSQVIVHDEGSSANFDYSLAAVTLHPTIAINLPAYRILRSDWNPQGLGAAIWVTGPLFGTPPLPLKSLELRTGSGADLVNVQSLPPGNAVVTIDGGSSTTTLQGPDTTNTWNITGPDTGTLDNVIDFSSLPNLTGGAGNDRFIYQIYGSTSGVVDGGAGTNTLQGPNTNTTYQLGGVNAGNIVSVVNAFTNIQNLVGGTGNDLFQAFETITTPQGFTFTIPGGLTGTLDGGGGSDTLQGFNLNSTWQITGPNAGNLNHQVNFVNIANLTGGLASDLFQVLPGGSLSGIVSGGGGNETLQGPDATNLWMITGRNSGNLNSAVSFYAIPNLLGGSGDDTFAFYRNVLTSVFGSIAGTVDGGAGTNTLDFSHYTGNILADLALHSAWAADQSFSHLIPLATREVNVENVIGSMGNDILVGDTEGNVLRGGTGRNLIIGGLGANTLYGGGDQNIIIGGYTDYDQKVVALQALMHEWIRTDRSFNQRISDIVNGGGLNGPFVLNVDPTIGPVTVHDNAAADAMYQSYTGALDWFFMHQNQDTIGPTSPGDRITRI
jgi:hypothetical protein